MNRLNASNRNPDPDAFERGSYYQSLADILCLSPKEESLVVGIEGPWGCGKTHSINKIKRLIEGKESKPMIIDFNPWLISSLDSLIEGFFTQLAVGIGKADHSKDAINAAKKVLELGKFLAPIKLIPGVEPWGTMVESVVKSVGSATKAAGKLSKLDLQGRKDRAQELLGKLNRPIVIVIDDIDRLPPNQVQLIFQLVKAVADFDGVSYFLSYDRDVVAAALSYDDAYIGAKYLEKIVMVTVPVPRSSNFLMRKMFDEQLRSYSLFYEVLLSEEETEIYSKLLYGSSLIRLLKTPRDVKRLLNALRLVVPVLKKEICLADLIGIEALRMSSSALFSKIVEDPYEHSTVSVGMERDMVAEVERKRFVELNETSGSSKQESPADSLKCSEHQKNHLDSVYGFLFKNVSPYNLRKLPRRICNSIKLMHYLHYTNLSYLPSEGQTDEFIAKPVCRKEMLEEYREYGTLRTFLDLVQSKLGESTDDVIGLVQLVAELSVDFRDDDFQGSVVFVTKLCPKLQPGVFLECWGCLLRLPHSLSFTLVVFLKLADGCGWLTNELFLKEGPRDLVHGLGRDDYFKLRETWLDAVRESANEGGIVLNQPNWKLIYNYWGKFGEFEEIQEHVEGQYDNPSG
jgi:hypothetical protein